MAWETVSVQPIYATAASAVLDVVMVNATNVNVRSQPNTTSKSYGKVTKGTYLARYENRADGWSCIDYAGKKAYIKTEFLLAFVNSSLPITEPTLQTSPSTGTQPSASYGATAPAVSTGAVAAPQQTSVGDVVWVSRTGTKYHKKPNCGNMSGAIEMTLSEALAAGKSACKKCY